MEWKANLIDRSTDAACLGKWKKEQENSRHIRDELNTTFETWVAVKELILSYHNGYI